jgi:hypothetical protein
MRFLTLILFCVITALNLSADSLDTAPIQEAFSDPETVEEAIHLEHERFKGSLLFILLCIPLAMLAIIRRFYPAELLEQWGAIQNQQVAAQQYRNREFALQGHNLILQSLFAVSISTWIVLFLQRVMGWWPMQIGLEQFLAVLLFVVLFSLARDLSRRLCARLFGAEEETGLFHLQIQALNALAGIVLIPFLFLMAFAQSSMAYAGAWISAVLLAVFIVWRTLNGLRLGIDVFRSNPIHFILYICTLEIAPILLTYSFVSDWYSLS